MNSIDTHFSRNVFEAVQKLAAVPTSVLSFSLAHNI